MKKEYKKHIVSTDKHQVWLHRTHTSNIESILKNGLYYGSGDLSSTATLQSPNLENAEQSYQLTHKGSNAVVVIKIPNNIVNKYYTEKTGEKGLRQNGYDSDKEVTYWHPEKRGITIQRQHVHGWIDKATDEYYPNPYLSEPQDLTDKHFPAQIYGGLEQDLLPEKTTKKNKLKKQKKLKRGELPPPPEQIVIP